MKNIIRILKNAFWYCIIMVSGYGYLTYMPLDGLYFIAGFLILAIVLYLAISKLRQLLRF